jgi:hypothetical protein
MSTGAGILQPKQQPAAVQRRLGVQARAHFGLPIAAEAGFNR